MMKIVISSVFICCIGGSFGFPMTVDVDKTADPEEVGGYFEGDMILSDEQEDTVIGGKNGLLEDRYRWPNKTVSYRIFPENFSTEQIDYIHRAMDNIAEASCLKFAEAPANAKAYVRVVGEKPGCFSTVGFHNQVQVVNLAPSKPGTGCFRIGTIMHEFLHTLGFYHMQSTTDRDDHVKIVWDKIKPKYRHNFYKYNTTYVTAFNEQYDYGSVLHYPEMAFSMDGNRTIIPKDPEAKIGQRVQMSEVDISKLNSMYNC